MTHLFEAIPQRPDQPLVNGPRKACLAQEGPQAGAVQGQHVGAGQVAVGDVCFGVQRLGLEVEGQGRKLYGPQVNVNAKEVMLDDGGGDLHWIAH